jgi:hypothetical protein
VDGMGPPLVLPSHLTSASANTYRHVQSRRGVQPKAGAPCLTRTFELGHRPVSDPLSRHHHAIGQSPSSAPPGRCRSTLSLGAIRAPTQRKAPRFDVSCYVARILILLASGAKMENPNPQSVHYFLSKLQQRQKWAPR